MSQVRDVRIGTLERSVKRPSHPALTPVTRSRVMASRIPSLAKCASVRQARRRMDWMKTRSFGRLWWAAAVAVLWIGAMLRIFDLGLKPLHGDEGVNGLFLLSLFRDGIY